MVDGEGRGELVRGGGKMLTFAEPGGHWASWGEWTNLFCVQEDGSTHEVKHIGIQPQMVVTGYGHSGEITFHAVGHEGARFASWSSTVSNAPSGTGSTYTLPISSNTPPGVYIVTGHGELGCDHVATVVVLKVDFIEASSDKADNSPQQFPGHQAWPFDPNNSTDPGKHLVVFFKDVVDASLNVLDFDVDLDAHILPNSVSDTSLSETWRKISGPASGSFDRTDTFSVKYQNPKKGGIYKTGFDLGLAGCVESEANIVLPLAGAEIDSIVQADITRANAFASTVVSNYTWLERQSPINGVRWFVYSGRGDYLGRPNNANSQTVRKYNQVASSGMGAVATWCGVPIRLAKVSNFMVGYGAKKIGVNPVFGWMSQVIGTFNDSAASKSWDAGWNIAGGSAYGSTVSNLVVDVWDEADDKNQKLWPNLPNADNYVVPSSYWDEDTQFTSPGYLYLMNP